MFGSDPATGVTVVSSSEVTAISPAGTGTVHVTVTTPGGTSAASATDRFGYVAPSTRPSSGAQGYWLTASDGGVFAFGSAGYFGSMGGKHLNAPVVGVEATPDGGGYWLVARDGGVFAFGSAGYFGSMGGSPPGSPVVGIAATPDGGGYWLATSNGSVIDFGDAGSLGSMAGKLLNDPIVATEGGE
jgi:hypothetical protein